MVSTGAPLGGQKNKLDSQEHNLDFSSEKGTFTPLRTDLIGKKIYF